MSFISLILVILVLLALSVFLYFILLTMNNMIWGHKDVPIDNELLVYRKRSLKLLSVFLSIMFLVLIGLVRNDNNAENPSSEPKEQIQMLAYKSGRSASDFQKGLGGLDKITDLDTLLKINEAISTVERVQLLLYQANQDADDLSDFINENKKQLQKEGLDVFLNTEGLRSETFFTNRKALREYLATYKAMLDYSKDNFDSIVKGKEPQRGEYEQLFLKYKNALDVQNEAYLQHMAFVNQYLQDHPALIELISRAREDLQKDLQGE
jgi:hypothetical protein